jgi:hypothetical protein
MSLIFPYDGFYYQNPCIKVVTLGGVTTITIGPLVNDGQVAVQAQVLLWQGPSGPSIVQAKAVPINLNIGTSVVPYDPELNPIYNLLVQQNIAAGCPSQNWICTTQTPLPGGISVFAQSILSGGPPPTWSAADEANAFLDLP